jgi:TRAP-type C4-dicarboxylate transport system permease small subunit
VSTLRAVERGLRACECAILVFLVCVLVGLSFLQVVLRSFFSSGLLWADTFLRHLVLWAGFLGAAVAVADGKHFALDAAGRFLQGRSKALARAAAQALACVICLLMGAAAWRFLQSERSAAGILFAVGSLQVPAWAMEVIVPAGFWLLALHYAIKMAMPAGREP